MRSATYQYFATRLRFGPDREPLARRTVVLLVVIGIHVLLVLSLLLLAPPEMLRKPIEAEIQMIMLPPPPPPREPQVPVRRAKRVAGGAAKARPKPKPATILPRAPLTPLDIPFDLAALPTSQKGAAPAEVAVGTGAGAGTSTGAASGAGQGPDGEPMFKAEWQREPTHAQLAGYLPKTGAPQDSWGLIACKTIDHFQVEDCRELDESPRGSGLARALRQAAWQFRVLPPRVGGKTLVGTWVSIRIDFSQSGDPEEEVSGPRLR